MEDLIAQMTSAAEEIAELYIWYRGYQERVHGSSGDSLYLGARPIVTVSLVQQKNGDSVTEGSGNDEFEIWADQGYLYRFVTWPSISYTVDYFGGWWVPSMDEPLDPGAQKLSDVRPDVELAIQEMVTTQWQLAGTNRTFKEVRQESLEEEILVKYRENIQVPKSAYDTLVGLRRPVV